MQKKILAGVGMFLASCVILFLIIFSVNYKPPVNYGKFDREVIKTLSESMDYEKYDPNQPIEADRNTGGLAEKTIGDVKTAKAVIYEYADYACVHCAEFNPTVNKLVASYNGRVALVFRNFILGFQNSVSAAAAANAAQLQGYWIAYKDLLFEKQAEWFRLTGETMRSTFEQYFTKVSEGKGDLKKFKNDMVSEAVAKRIAFDYGIGGKMGVGGTPMFYLDGKKINVTDLKTALDKKLNQ